MDTATMNSMFGFMDFLVLGCGVYGIYSWYMLMKKHEIKKAFLLGGSNQPENCQDVEGFANAIGTKLLVTSIVMLVFSSISLYNSYKQSIGGFYWVAMVLFLAVLVWYMFFLRKANDKFFNTKSSLGIKDKALNKKK